MRAAIDFLSSIILLGLNIIPFALVAALIRGGLRGRSDRAAQKREIESFD